MVKNKKIQISIVNKNGKKTLITINVNNKNKYVYDKKFKGIVKKSKIFIKKEKFVKKSRKKEKIISKKVKRIVEKKKEKIIVKKEIVKKEKKEKKKPISKCNFNYDRYYKGVNHIGYVRLNQLSFLIDEDTTQREILVMIKILKDFLENEFHKLKCPQRMSYCRLHYRLQVSSNMDDIRESSNTTNVSFNLKTVMDRTEEIFYLIINNIESYTAINIYKQEFVNYEFKSVIES